MTTTTAAERRHGGAPPESPFVVRVLYVPAPGRPRAGLIERLGRLGYVATIASDGADALRVLVEHQVACCVLDLAGDRLALTAVRLIRARHTNMPLVGIVDATVPAVAAEALRHGVADLLAWPFDDHEMATVLANIQDRLPGIVPDIVRSEPQGLVACSPAMRTLLARVREVADSRQPVWLSGPRGTGKALVARALHEASSHPDAPFLSVDCGTLAPAELASQLFGGVEDSASSRHPDGPAVLSSSSVLARVRGGTLFVHHLDDAPAGVQRRLAVIFRDREAVLREDGQTIDLDVRLVAATREPLDALSGHRLRPELADRFSVHLEVPPLRRRREDIAPLAATFLMRASTGRDKPRSFSRAALELLSALPWPGNARELEEVVARLVTDGRRPVVQVEEVLAHVRIDGAPHLPIGVSLREARDQFERDCIVSVLARHHGRVGEAARALGIQRTNLYRKVRQLGISKNLLSSHR